MPFATFEPSDAGARHVEQFQSLMDRAQRRKVIEADLKMQMEHHAASIATSNIQRENLSAQLSQNQINLTEAERVSSLRADLRKRFDPVTLNRNADLIRQMRDPLEQRRALSQLESAYSEFTADPELSRVIQTSLGGLEPVIATNEKSKLHEKIRMNQFARSPEEAAAKFPGRLVSPMVDPATGATLFVAEDAPDPQFEQRAMALLSVAAAKGDIAAVEAVLQDPAANSLLGVPGSKFLQAFNAAMTSAGAKAEKIADREAKAAKEAKGTQLTDTATASIGSFRIAEKDLKKVEQAFDKVAQDWRVGPIAGRITGWSTAWNKDFQTLESLINQTVPNLARGVFREVGVLTDKDVERYRDMLPNAKRDPEVARQLFTELNDKLRTGFELVIDNYKRAGYDTSGFEDMRQAKAPVAGSKVQAIARGL